MGFFEQHAFVLEACLAAAFLTASSALVGCFLLIRRKSLMGDMLGHSVLPGLCVGFVLAGFQKSVPLMMLGALVSALIAGLLQDQIPRKSRIKQDSSMAILLTGFYAIGIVFLGFLQNYSGASAAGLESYLLGHAASLSRADLIGAILLFTTQIIFYSLFVKELRATTFDPLFAQTQGLPNRRINQIIAALTSISVVLALPAVGLILASALLILPAACASLFTKNLVSRLSVASLIGFVFGGSGTFLSTLGTKFPTGPTLILLHSVFFLLISLVIYFNNRRTHKELAYD